MKTFLTTILKITHRARVTVALLAATILASATAFAVTNDLSIAVTVTPETAVIGDEIIYHCVVTNNGPDTTTSIYGYIGPDNNQVPEDIYMTFDTANPPVTSIDPTGFRQINLPNVGSGASTTFDVAYVATAAGSPSRLIGTSTIPFDSDPNPGNNSTNVSLTIASSLPPPTPPPHGGLSPTQFTVNGSKTGLSGLQDTVLRFSALQTGFPAELKVRVQSSSTANPTWTDLPNGSGGYMTLDETNGYFVLSSLNYPLQNGVSFRAISSASGYADSISNVVGPFDLATSTAHVGPTTLFLATNGPGQEIKFRAKQTTALSGVFLRIQQTTTPGDESSWSDLADGNNGYMFPYADPTLFYLNTKNYMAGTAVYFRAVASHDGRIDSISNEVGVNHLVIGTAPEMEIIPPFPEPGSGSGLSPDDPIIVSTGTLTFGAQLATSGTLSEIGLLYDGTVIETRGGGTSFTLPYYTTVGGDHIITAYGINSAGIKGFAPPVYIRIKPLAGKIFTRVSAGSWNDASKWHDGLGATGVPGTNDIAVIGALSVSITQNVSAYAVALNGGTITGAGGGLTINQFFSITGGQLISLNTTVTSTGTVALSSDTNVPMSGSWINYGTFKLNGRGSIVAVPLSGDTHALLAPSPNGFFDGALTAITNFGKWIISKLSTPPPPSPPPPVTPPPVEVPRAVVASVFENKGQLIGPNGAGAISDNGAGVIAPNGATIIGNDGASLITNDGGSLITNDGGSLITNDGGSIISNDGASLITNDGGSIQAETEAGSAAPATGGLLQTSGETDLSGMLVVGNLSLEGGVLSGAGAIAGTLTNSGGFVSPGHSAGAISIVGDFIQGAEGTLIVEDGGALPNEFDQLSVTGTATLGGTLDVKLIDGYQPDPADTFAPLAATAVSGTFASVSSNAQISVDANGVLLSADPSRPSPEAAKPLNISTRLNVQTGDNVLIAGFIVNGPEESTKKVLLRAIGPSLPLTGTLADPVLELHPSGGAVITNDNWKSDQEAAIAATGLQPGNDLESAIIATLPVGAHTAILRGQNDGTGIGLVEVYDLEGDNVGVQLANISTRGKVETGDNVMIGGFIVGGIEPTTVLVRALGPSLTAAGVTGALANPVLELHDSNGNITLNDDWRSTQALEIENSIPPSDDAESALSITLVPGAYTAIVRGKDDTAGVALVEVYNLQ
jgi:hypothetical protein